MAAACQPASKSAGTMTTYKIDPEVLSEVCNEVLEFSLDDGTMFREIRSRLAERYPGIVDPSERPWIGSRAGGVLGKLTLLYASLNEYLIIFGTPVGTQGFSGRYNHMQIWDFFVAGETSTCDLETDQIVPDIYGPGDTGFLDKGHSLTCEMKPGSWMIEYGRGPNITALPFALMDSLLSSVELKSFFLTMSEYSRFILRSFRGPG